MVFEPRSKISADRCKYSISSISTLSRYTSFCNHMASDNWVGIWSVCVCVSICIYRPSFSHLYSRQFRLNQTSPALRRSLLRCTDDAVIPIQIIVIESAVQSHFKVFLQLIHRGRIETAVNISVSIECDMYVGMTEPILENDRLHPRLDAPGRKCVPE